MVGMAVDQAGGRADVMVTVVVVTAGEETQATLGAAPDIEARSTSKDGSPGSPREGHSSLKPAGT